MVGCRILSTLTKYANLIAGYDNNLYFLRKRSKNHYKPVVSDPDAMDVNAFNYAPFGLVERERRRRKGLCFNYGSDDHLLP
jgi:hypothetical protein